MLYWVLAFWHRWHGMFKHKLILAGLSIITLSSAVPVAAKRPAPAGPDTVASQQAAWQQHQQLTAESEFHGLKWRAIGPVVQGGRVVDIEVDPNNPYTFYAAYASGGLWKTSNNGVSFQPLTDAMPTMIIGDIAIDPNNSEVLWVGTGEANSSRSSYGGMGMYKSADGGASWQHMGLAASDRIARVLIDPRNSQRLLVAALGKLYTPGGQRGVFVSDDGGASWRNTLPGEGYTGAIDLVMNPANPDIVYAATWERRRTPWEFTEGGDGSGIWRSEDGGESWTRLDDRAGSGLPSGDQVGRIGLALAPSQPDTLYAVIDHQALLPEDQWDLGDRALSAKRLRNMSEEEFLAQSRDELERFVRGNDFPDEVTVDGLISMLKNDELSLDDLLARLNEANANLFNSDIKGLELYRSDDGGKRWRKTHEQPLDGIVYTYGYYFGQVRVAPDDADTVYLTGVPIAVSSDGGKTFSGHINDPDVHVDYHAWWINPANSQHMLIGNDGGIDVTFDGGKSWLKLDAQPVGQFYAINVDMAKPYNVYGGLQDNGTLKGSSRTDWEDGPSWSRIFGGDGFQVQIDHDDQQTYVGYQFGNYARLGDGPPATMRPRAGLRETPLRYNWMTPILLSPHNADIVYFGSNKLFRSLDEGDSWTAISDDLSRSSQRGDVPFATITVIDESPQQFGLLWAGTDDGQLWLTEDGGQQWRDVSDGLPRDRWITRVVASKHQRERAYVSLNGYRNDDSTAYLYRSDDLGRRWRDISANLPAEAINVVREDPVNGDILYVGTDRSVYVSVDAGDSWQALNSGLPNVPVHDLVVHPRERELVAGTHGRSIWIADVLPLQELNAAVREQGLHVFHIDEIQFSRRWQSEPSRWFGHLQEPLEAVVHFWSESDGDGSYEIVDANDRVLKRGELQAQPGINRLDIVLQADEQLALSAEQAANADQEDIQPADQPYQQARKYGHPLYLQPGEYTVRVQHGDAQASGKLTVAEPDPWPKRGDPEPELRGRK